MKCITNLSLPFVKNYLDERFLFFFDLLLLLNYYAFFQGPGIFFIVPCIDTYKKLDLRTVSFDVPPQVENN